MPGVPDAEVEGEVNAPEVPICDLCPKPAVVQVDRLTTPPSRRRKYCAECRERVLPLANGSTIELVPDDGEKFTSAFDRAPPA